MLDAALLIDNLPVDATGNATFDRLNPVSREVATRAGDANVSDAVHAANVAARAFPLWSQTPPTERRAILNRAADLMLAREADFAEAMISETGGTRAWAAFNCRLGASILREEIGRASCRERVLRLV